MKLRILSYNIHKGFSTTGRVFTLHKMKQILHQTQADIMFLQEVVGENIHHQKKIEHWPRESQFEFLAHQNWPHHQYGKNAIYDGRHHGNAILSKFPITFFENQNISTNRREQRGLLHVIVRIEELNKELHLFNVHLNLFEKARLQQLQWISERFKSQVPSNCGFILAGDFNDWTQKVHTSTVETMQVNETFECLHKKLPVSFPSIFPTLPLDRIYVKNLEVKSAHVLSGKDWASLSDHLPLLVDLEVK